MLKKILKITAKLLNIAITVVLAVLLICQIYTIIAKAVLKKPYATVFGFRTAVVLTGSMADTINPNDLIITKSQKEYAVGDIITYQTGGTPVTHRIIEITDSGFITKGDANNTADSEITKSRIIGKVVLVIPKAGKGIIFMQTPAGMLCVTLILSLLLFAPAFIKKKE